MTLDLAARVSRGRGFPVMPLRGERMSREESARRRALREAVRARLGERERGGVIGHPAVGSQRGTPGPAARGGVGEGERGREGGETFGREVRRGRESHAELEVGGVEGEVLLLSAEDDVGDTIRPRLEAAGADVSRVHIFRGMQRGARRRFVALERDLEAIGRHLKESGRYRLVVIDPISAYLDGLDANSNQDVRSLLAELAEIAETSGAAVILVSHLRKSKNREPAVYRTLGSVAFTAVARAVWTVVRDPIVPERRLMLPVKMNLGPVAGGMAFRIRGQEAGVRSQEEEVRGQRSEVSGGEESVGVVEWEPEPIEVTADEATPEALADSDRGDRLEVAKTWLERMLLLGPRTANELKRAAREAQVSREALWEAKRELRVRAVKEGVVWRWHLPAWHVPLPEVGR